MRRSILGGWGFLFCLLLSVTAFSDPIRENNAAIEPGGGATVRLLMEGKGTVVIENTMGPIRIVPCIGSNIEAQFSNLENTSGRQATLRVQEVETGKYKVLVDYPDITVEPVGRLADIKTQGGPEEGVVVVDDQTIVLGGGVFLHGDAVDFEAGSISSEGVIGAGDLVVRVPHSLVSLLRASNAIGNISVEGFKGDSSPVFWLDASTGRLEISPETNIRLISDQAVPGATGCGQVIEEASAEAEMEQLDY